MTIYDGGWQSVTTKSRLNALCQEFCVKGEYVFQKDFAWYVRKFVGAINGQSVYKTEEFDNGYVFAWSSNCHSLTNNKPMRIFFSSLVIILGANLLINLLDSNLVDIMNERKNTVEKLYNDL